MYGTKLLSIAIRLVQNFISGVARKRTIDTHLHCGHNFLQTQVTRGVTAIPSPVAVVYDVYVSLHFFFVFLHLAPLDLILPH